MFEGDENDLYAEDFHENDDSDDTYSNSVVDEANENEADVAGDDHAGTNPVSKTFAANKPMTMRPTSLLSCSMSKYTLTVTGVSSLALAMDVREVMMARIRSHKAAKEPMVFMMIAINLIWPMKEGD